MMINRQQLFGHVQSNKTLYLFMTTLFVTGIVFGAIIVNSMSFIQKQDLFFHLNQFFSKLNTGEPIVSKDILSKSIFFHVQYLLVVCLLGLTIIGIPFIWLLIFIKGLAIGFSVGFIVNQLGLKGLLIASLSIAPQNVLIIPIYIVAACIANLFSLLLLQKIMSKSVSSSIGRPFVQYVFSFMLLVLASFFASVIESFFSYEAVKITIDRL